MVTLLLSLAFIALSAALILSIVYWTLRNGISPMPSSRHAKQEILHLAIAIGPEKIYELGSGFGSLLIPLAKENLRAQIVGYETSPIPYFITWVRIKIAGLSNAKVIRKDFLHADLSDAGLVVCYLYPKGMEKLANKFEKGLKKGVYVISNTFSLPGWTPLKTIRVNDFYQSNVYLYKR